MLDELAAAFVLLTRLPAGRLARMETPFAASIWAYPVVGAVVGGIGAAAYLAALRAGLPVTLAALLSISATLLATGALHEDGLADTADGFGGGRSRERKLEIMRDSRIGSFGALALMLALAFRVAAMVAITPANAAALALVAAGSLARGAMIVPLLLLAPARTDGLAAGLRARAGARAVLGLALSAGAAFALLRPEAAARAVAAALVVSFGMAWLARRQVGGYTGDVLGAAAVVAECAVLGMLASG